jgi:glycerophosphoryl diester phosphodiesterase
MSSFHHGSLVRARERIPSLNVGLLYWYGLYEPGKYARDLEAATLNCHWKAVDRELVEDARASGVEVLAFTVWTEDEIRAIASTGLRGIIAADAEVAVNVRSRLDAELAGT